VVPDLDAFDEQAEVLGEVLQRADLIPKQRLVDLVHPAIAERPLTSNRIKE
jgi:hypothetical protein